MLERFLALTAAHPDAVALIDPMTGAESGRATTRATLLARAREIARRHAEGELVAVQLPNSIELVATFLAALIGKFAVMMIDRDERDPERIVAHFRGAALPADARLIKLTSGSTGAPKGIVASEANLAADCRNICATMDIRPGDINLGAIPMSHSYGFSNLVTPLLMQGTAVVISNDYLPQSIVDYCNRYGVTVVPAVPMVFDHLASAATGELETVRTFLSAGAPLSPSVSRRFRERFGTQIHTFYGCSECGGITYDRSGGAVERGTVGRAMDGVTLSVERSRLIVRGENVSLGYLHDAKTFEPFAPGRFRADDLAEIRDDGEVVLIGRASELINIAGRKVNPREVEQVLIQSDGVQQARAYGEPAGARGEVVAAAIVARPDVTRDQVREFCRARLSPHKVPRIIKLIDAIPVDDRGKVRRSALAEL
jgi:long-chain acyl-CoA synthetase